MYKLFKYHIVILPDHLTWHERDASEFTLSLDLTFITVLVSFLFL